jgi:transposase
VERVSREVGISVATLERWRADALVNGAVGGSQRWTAAARLEAVIVTAAMDEAARSAWCREQGLYPAELDAWKRDAIAGLGEPRAASAVEARQDRRRVKELERNFIARTRHWPKRPPCLCCQKNSRRSSTKARTHDPPGRPPNPGA